MNMMEKRVMKVTWNEILNEEKKKSYFINLMNFVEEKRKTQTIYPPQSHVFKAFDLCEFQNVKVVILGQDPYHQPNQAMGLAFSVQPEMPLPKSLHNIFKELKNDLGIENKTGDLSRWASQGVFLMNTILTVEESNPLSHQNKGWEQFTDTIIEKLNDDHDFLIFVLWGNEAKKKKSMISDRHYIVEASHPSPLSAYRSFNGSKPFSEINKQLKLHNLEQINWDLHV